ncbi:MAG: cation diffusion facilitator family transporter [Thermoleophilaceae bacterium]
MSHDHAHVQTEPAREGDRARLWIALGLILALMAGEVVAGIVAGSLALLSDAAHMLTDAAAIGLALFAGRLADRPPRGGYTYGLRRAEILSAQANGATLLALAAVIAFEAVRRLIDPPGVEGAIVLVVALVGVAVNLVATWVLAGANRRSLNVEGAFQHILTDLFAFVATAAAGAAILLTGFVEADGIAALIVAALMTRAGWGLLRDSGRILLEGAPRGIEPDEVARMLAAEPDVVEVHDLHVWEVTSGFPALTAHVLLEPSRDCHQRRRDFEALLRERFGIEHTTIQVDHAQGAQAPIELERAPRRGDES